MNCRDIISELRSNASEAHKKNVVRMGIPEEYSMGVPTPVIRKLAKTIGISHETAFGLWRTGYHEAKLLAVLLFDNKKITPEDVEYLISDVASWDLCDHLCKNLIIRQKDCHRYITAWITSSRTYKKRAAFTLMASSAIHGKDSSGDRLDEYLNLIREHSQDGNEHVKKAASWALREIGKKDFNYCEKALLVAYDLKENGNRTQVWIAKDAVKELENLVKTDGRSRLISAGTKMGRGL